jgi:glucokinase
MVPCVPTDCVIGVDLGGTKLLAGLVREDLEVLDRRFRVAPVFTDAEQLLDGVVDDVRALLESGIVAPRDVRAVGVGIPSLIDRERGTAVSTVHQPLAGVPVRDELQDRLQLPVALDNDANCAVLAEWRAGAAKGCDDVVLLTVGTGIGSGVVSGGRLLRGSTGAATELGHTVIAFDGPPCSGSCANHGCLEVFVSGPAVGREGTRLAAERPDSGLGRLAAEGASITGIAVTELAQRGDEAAIEALARVGTLLGVGVANAMNTFNPELVLIGGGVSDAGELLIGPARAEARRRARPPSNEARVEIGGFGPDAGMVGAAVLALEDAR